MSIKMMSWAFHDTPEDLSPAQVLVLVALADAADDEGHVRFLPEKGRNQDQLARKCRMSRRTMQRALEVLEDRGLIRRSSGLFMPDTYTLVRHIGASGRQDDATAARQNDASSSIDGISDGTRARKPKAKPHPLPADWEPSPEAVALAEQRGIDLQTEADAFRAHAEAHAREVTVWHAAFRQWLIKARPGAAAAARPQTLTEKWGAGNEWMERG